MVNKGAFKDTQGELEGCNNKKVLETECEAAGCGGDVGHGRHFHTASR